VSKEELEALFEELSDTAPSPISQSEKKTNGVPKSKQAPKVAFRPAGAFLPSNGAFHPTAAPKLTRPQNSDNKGPKDQNLKVSPSVSDERSLKAGPSLSDDWVSI
jgi:hypothetical protein